MLLSKADNHNDCLTAQMAHVTVGQGLDKLWCDCHGDRAQRGNARGTIIKIYYAALCSSPRGEGLAV